MAQDANETREFSSALADIGRAGLAIADNLHENNTRMAALEREHAGLRIAIDTRNQLELSAQELRGQELELQSQRLVFMHEREDRKEEAERKAEISHSEHQLKLVREASKFLQSRAGLILCGVTGAISVLAAQTMFGKGPVVDVLHLLRELVR